MRWEGMIGFVGSGWFGFLRVIRGAIKTGTGRRNGREREGAGGGRGVRS